MRDFVGGTPAEKPEAVKKASPLTYVTRDELVPHTQAVKLADALTAAGVPGRVELLLGAGHGLKPDDMKRTLIETVEFLDGYLKPGKK